MENVEFLNIDLDLESTEDLSLLLRELGDAVVVMNNESENGVYKASLELAGLHGGAEYLFGCYIDLIDSLSGAAKDLWFKCTKREFDVGFESGSKPIGGIQEKLSAELLNALSRLNISLAITVYAQMED